MNALRLNPPAGLDIAFPLMSDLSANPPYAVNAAAYAPELAATIAERRDFNQRMVDKHSMTEGEARRDLALLADLALDVGHPQGWPRADRGFAWAEKLAELRRVLAHRRKALAGGLAVGPGNREPIRRMEALEGLHWAMTIELAWCDAFADLPQAVAVASIRAWHWAIDQWERRAADRGEAWARPDRSTAGRAAFLERNPAIAAAFFATEQAERDAAIELGIAVAEEAA